MPTPYSQDLRDRVIEAVERDEMSCRAVGRRYEISESAAINVSGTAIAPTKSRGIAARQSG